MKFNRNSWFALLGAAAIFTLAPTVHAEYESKPDQTTTQTSQSESTTEMIMPLGQFLESREDLSTLYTALQEADLISTLEGLDAFTIFAPTNQAFEALPPGQLDALLAEPETLAQVLQYHVVDQTLSSSDLQAQDYDSLEGTPLTVETDPEVTVGDATVLETDLTPETGTVHTIDTVLVPESVTLPESSETTSEEESLTEPAN